MRRPLQGVILGFDINDKILDYEPDVIEWNFEGGPGDRTDCNFHSEDC